MSRFSSFIAELRPEVDAALDRLLPPVEAEPVRLHDAMRYCIFAGGKRFRPAMLTLGGEIYRAPRELLLGPAAAMEMIHTFSLVHDDLPALDDDGLRRGKQTVHLRFDEATAILAGDALLNQAIYCLSREPADADAAVRCRGIEMAAEAVGSFGMIGGQAADIEAEREWPADPVSALETVHRRKTGQLLVLSLCLGGLYAGAGEPELALLRELGKRIGVLFQIGDDILDVEGESAELGKTAGKDQAAGKLTYPALFGLEESRRRLSLQAEETLALIESFPSRQEVLLDLVRYLLERDH